MAIARLHGGPLDGQVLPLEDPQLDRMIVPYSETQVVYERKGSPENTGDGDGPTEAEFRGLVEEYAGLLAAIEPKV